MLRELLERIASARGGTKENVARELGLGPAEIDDMIARLLSLGYIEDMASPCSSCSDGEEGGARSPCASCSMCSAGALGPKARVWALSAKGRAALGPDGGPGAASDRPGESTFPHPA
jgi:hypothetical protein